MGHPKSQRKKPNQQTKHSSRTPPGTQSRPMVGVVVVDVAAPHVCPIPAVNKTGSKDKVVGKVAKVELKVVVNVLDLPPPSESTSQASIAK